MKNLCLALVTLFVGCLSNTAVIAYNQQLTQLSTIDNAMMVKLRIYNAEHQMQLITALLKKPAVLQTEIASFRQRQTALWSSLAAYETQNQTQFTTLTGQTSKTSLPALDALITAAQSASTQVDQFCTAEDQHLQALVQQLTPEK